MSSSLYSAFHPDPPGVSKKSKEALARGLKLMYMSGTDFSSPEEATSNWWNTKVENMYRCQVAGYRDEKDYLEKRRLKVIDKWPRSGLIRKLIRWDGMYYYFPEGRECPKLKCSDVKKALLHETVIFENSPYTDKTLQWTPVVSAMTQKINNACDEIIKDRPPPKPREMERVPNTIIQPIDDSSTIVKERRSKRSSNKNLKSTKLIGKKYNTLKENNAVLHKECLSSLKVDEAEDMKDITIHSKEVRKYSGSCEGPLRRTQNITKKTFSVAAIRSGKELTSKRVGLTGSSLVLGANVGNTKGVNKVSVSYKNGHMKFPRVEYKDYFLLGPSKSDIQQGSKTSVRKCSVRDKTQNLNSTNNTVKNPSNNTDPQSIILSNRRTARKPPSVNKETHSKESVRNSKTSISRRISKQGLPLHKVEISFDNNNICCKQLTPYSYHTNHQEINLTNCDNIAGVGTENKSNLKSDFTSLVTSIYNESFMNDVKISTETKLLGSRNQSVSKKNMHSELDEPEFGVETRTIRNITDPILQKCWIPRNSTSSQASIHIDDTIVPNYNIVQRPSTRQDPRISHESIRDPSVTKETVKLSNKSGRIWTLLEKQKLFQNQNESVDEITMFPRGMVPKRNSVMQADSYNRSVQLKNMMQKYETLVERRLQGKNYFSERQRLKELEMNTEVENWKHGIVDVRDESNIFKKGKDSTNDVIGTMIMEGTRAPRNSAVNLITTENSEILRTRQPEVDLF
ncbi:uncharacterized protein [Periplaneta americana]|uniref:uncharacterized protein n=1 Tax=Periplaneta americana TaxID=6978 RepID=UPI0037E9705C